MLTPKQIKQIIDSIEQLQISLQDTSSLIHTTFYTSYVLYSFLSLVIIYVIIKTIIVRKIRGLIFWLSILLLIQVLLFITSQALG